MSNETDPLIMNLKKNPNIIKETNNEVFVELGEVMCIVHRLFKGIFLSQ